jgi:hypothetical protein
MTEFTFVLPGIKDIRIIIHLRLNDGLCVKKNMLDFFFFSLEKNILVMEMFMSVDNLLNFGWNLRNIGNALRKSGFSKATLYVYLYEKTRLSSSDPNCMFICMRRPCSACKYVYTYYTKI